MTSRSDDTDRATAANIRARRIALGMTQTALGKAAGVSGGKIHKFESGRDRVKAGQLYVLAEALYCEPADLMPSGDAAEDEARDRLAAFMETAASLDEQKLHAICALVRGVAGPTS